MLSPLSPGHSGSLMHCSDDGPHSLRVSGQQIAALAMSLCMIKLSELGFVAIERLRDAAVTISLNCHLSGPTHRKEFHRQELWHDVS